MLTSAEGEYVNIISLKDKIYTGTLLFDNPSAHANKDRETTNRSLDNMHIRLDEEVYTKDDVTKLEIAVGDIIAFEPRYRDYENGFIKSRFMDNKAGCFVLFEIARYCKEKNITPPVELFFSNYEEVGHGGTVGYSDTVNELLVIDMGVLGDACEGNEVKCSICAKIHRALTIMNSGRSWCSWQKPTKYLLLLMYIRITEAMAVRLFVPGKITK